ncbi:MAG: peptidylprolyl isomerase, partial [Catalinimonas sp.]
NGWGSTDVTIRSEFTARPYRTGSVGVASAGPDTESCQWFVTHLPTPHLEGRYTQFAVVESGQDVIALLGEGDLILHIRRVD